MWGLRGTGEKHETELFRCRRRRLDHEGKGAIGWDRILKWWERGEGGGASLPQAPHQR